VAFSSPCEDRRTGGETDLSPPLEDHPLASTAQILAQAQTGDGAARGELLLRYREPLARFLHGRLSPSSRGALDTDDIVQDVLTAALVQLEGFEYRGLGSFWGYLRRIGINLILQEERRQGIRPIEGNDSAPLDAVTDGARETPPAAMLRKETFEAFEAALEEVAEPARGALLLRLELGLPYGLIASECGYPSADAARMAIGRGMAWLAHELAGFEP
jgi:RNA polymerase sigma-70 factor (ECF subfamily)